MSGEPLASVPLDRHELAALREFGAHDRLTPARGPYQAKAVSMRKLERRRMVRRIVKDDLIWDWRMTPEGWDAYATLEPQASVTGQADLARQPTAPSGRTGSLKRRIRLTPVEQAMDWERMTGERLSEAERHRIVAGGAFVAPDLTRFRDPRLSDPVRSDEDLLREAVRSARPNRSRGRRTQARWLAVMDTFALDFNSAHALCCRFGIDPDEKVKP